MEKRQYQREVINCIGLFYIQGGEYGKIEFDGVVTDISENGMAIKIVEPKCIMIADEVQVGTELKFCFIDKYEIFRETKNVDITGIATVVRKDKNADRLIIGCTFRGDRRKIEQYVSDKKMITFMSVYISKSNI